MTDREMELLHAVLCLPTAPFREDAVVAFVRDRAGRHGVSFARDDAGNVLLSVGGDYRDARWLVTAHMDHPGFVVRARRGRTVHADFRGGVAERFFPGSRVRFLPPDGDVVARVSACAKGRRGPWLRCRAELIEPRPLPRGTIGMWDLPPLRVRGSRLHARACDDLAGTAAVLCTLERLARRKPPAPVAGLLTRGEEAGFIGALAACRGGSIPPDAAVVGIETSKAQPAAPLGGGVVLRVGDRARTFDPSVDAFLHAAAGKLARRDESFRFVRRLMPGGTCESTVYCAFGHRAGAVALPLGNYHNMADNGRIAAEVIDAGDFSSLVMLLAAVTRRKDLPADADAALRRRLDGLWQRRGRFLGE